MDPSQENLLAPQSKFTSKQAMIKNSTSFATTTLALFVREFKERVLTWMFWVLDQGGSYSMFFFFFFSGSLSLKKRKPNSLGDSLLPENELEMLPPPATCNVPKFGTSGYLYVASFAPTWRESKKKQLLRR